MISCSVNIYQQADVSTEIHYLILFSIFSFYIDLLLKISSIAVFKEAEFQYFSIKSSSKSLFIPELTNLSSKY